MKEGQRGELGRPVFVLAGSRSGSTLLRLILDAHPELACPPETGVGGACARLAGLVGMLEGLEQPQAPGRACVSVSGAMAVRRAVEAAYQPYLARRGKRRWCDKSLDNAAWADLLARLWPEARFVCLVRHCMDVIASGIEVNPWGMSGFGLGRFAAQYPGNSVATAGAAWRADVETILAFARRNPGRCHWVRYEDLVSNPEPVVAGVFSFLGACPAPGITRTFLGAEHDTNGPGDAKVWFTPGISPGSIAQGVMVPAALLPQQLRAGINEALAELGYRPVTQDWNQAVVPEDPRGGPGAGTAEAAGAHRGDPRDPGLLERAAAAIAARTAGADSETLARIVAGWPRLAGARLRIVAYDGPGRAREFHWRLPGADGPRARQHTAAEPTAVQLTAAQLTAVPPGEAQPEAERTVAFTAEAQTWLALLAGCTNLGTELITGRVRRAGVTWPWQPPAEETQALAGLLGLAAVQAPPPQRQAGAPLSVLAATHIPGGAVCHRLWRATAGGLGRMRPGAEPPPGPDPRAPDPGAADPANHDPATNDPAIQEMHYRKGVA